MLEKFNRFISEHKLCRKTDHILLAVSGGVDSMVMMDLFYKSGYAFSIAHCNFNLRGSDSDGDEELVKKAASVYHSPIFTNSFQTEGYAEVNKLSIQLAARELRYDWFRKLLNEGKGNLIATAHHLDDQLETVLYNLSKGVGIYGISGIPVQDGKVIRPLIFASKEEIMKYASDEGINWREDVSNATIKYKRNFIRHEVVPRLREINPSLTDTFRRTSKRLGEAKKIILESVKDFAEKHSRREGSDIFISINALLPRNATFAEALLKDYNINYQQAEEILECMKREAVGKIFLTSTHKINIDREEIVVSKFQDKEEDLVISKDELGTYGGFYISKLRKEEAELETNPAIAMLDYDKLDFPLKVRTWKKGDRFVPLGMQGQKKLSDFMIDNKIAVNLKDSIFVIESADKIAWVVGHRIDDRYKITGSTKTVYKIEWHNEKSI